MKAIIGKKVGMSQIFDENGKVIPVTVIEAGPCTVVQKKTSDKEGYEAVQLGYEDIPERKLSKPEMGHLNKAGVAPKKYLREFNLDNATELNVGDIVKADTFKEGDFVDVTGTSKGHGYQGVIKRWGAQRTPTSHGGGPVHRHAGSMGSTTAPSRIFKGKIGAGVTMHRAGTVCLFQAGSTVALNNALVAVALADAGDVHAVARGEHVSLQLVADLVLGAVVQTELLQDLLELGHAGLLLMADLGLGELALSNRLITQLNGLIAILLGGLLLHHGAGAGLDHGHRDHVASFIEDLGHADLFADDRFLHVGFSSYIGYWLGELPIGLVLLGQLDPSASICGRQRVHKVIV